MTLLTVIQDTSDISGDHTLCYHHFLNAIAAGAVGHLITGFLFLSAAPKCCHSWNHGGHVCSKARIWATLPWTAVVQHGNTAGLVMSAYVAAAWDGKLSTPKPDRVRRKVKIPEK